MESKDSKLKMKIAETEFSLKVTGFGMGVEMLDTAHTKMMHWVHKAGSDEVSGLGLIKVMPDKLIVTDTFLLPQKNTSGSTDFEPDAMAKLMYELREETQLLRFWWHSHVRMGTFWSSVDTKNMDELAAGGWFLSMVVNQLGSRRTAFRSLEPNLFIDEIPAQIVSHAPAALTAQWDTEYEANVKKKVISPSVQDWRKKLPGKSGQGKNGKRQKNKTTSIGTNGIGTIDSPSFDHVTGLQAYGRYDFWWNKCFTTAYITHEDLAKGTKTVWYRDGKTKVCEVLTLKQIADAAFEYITDVSDDYADDPVIWDNTLDQAQIEMLPNWEDYRVFDEDPMTNPTYDDDRRTDDEINASQEQLAQDWMRVNGYTD